MARQVRTGRSSTAGAYWSTLRLIARAASRLADAGLAVHVNWIPGHSGLDANERADEAARGACGIDAAPAPRLVQVLIPYAVSARRLRDAARQLWDLWWVADEGVRASVCRDLLQPTAYVAPPNIWYQPGGDTPEHFVGRLVATCVDRMRLDAAITEVLLSKAKRAADGSAVGSAPKRCPMCAQAAVVVAPAEGHDPVAAAEGAYMASVRAGTVDSLLHRLEYCPHDAYVRARQHLLERLRPVPSVGDDLDLYQLLALEGVGHEHRREVVDAVCELIRCTDVRRFIYPSASEVGLDDAG